MSDVWNIEPANAKWRLHMRRLMNEREPCKSSRFKIARLYRRIRKDDPRAARWLWRYLKRQEAAIVNDMLEMVRSRSPSFADLVK